ncbi:MAG: hypothetical protein A2126_02480 [Candidatus Woykebacteria bacterium GWB1_45_5]|uniref:Uncharacterized protein n=2 Tax=Candidatus Woykeibacteriota TaxID=1817899 RepID=A0A1G1W0V1_9BACT|nr:MAG: hypothetical protein A2113_00160 [Candidatus Woykebacteria bacterium GWA1_44_8]OGY23687.1 MAG: hypothetical protein A2126_02480 [Candidatus Woykebacteria bacterium GWB1_45_5]
MVRSAQPATPEININLMPAPRPSGTAGAAVQWVLTVGRYLIIFTEIVALAIFVLGIKLSADKNDLKEQVENLKVAVSSDSNVAFEKEFREIQQKINEIKKQRANHFPSSVVVTELLKMLPQGLSLNSLEIKEDEVVFSGSFTSPSELQTLVSVFSESEKITGLDISDLNSPSEKNPLYTFKATANIIQSKFKSKEASK